MLDVGRPIESDAPPTFLHTCLMLFTSPLLFLRSFLINSSSLHTLLPEPPASLSSAATFLDVWGIERCMKHAFNVVAEFFFLRIRCLHWAIFHIFQCCNFFFYVSDVLFWCWNGVSDPWDVQALVTPFLFHHDKGEEPDQFCIEMCFWLFLRTTKLATQFQSYQLSPFTMHPYNAP